MENIIKGVAKLQGIATQEQLQVLEESAQRHRRFSRIDFKVLMVSSDEVIIEVRQGKNPNGNHFNSARLIEIGKEWFAGVANNVHFRPIEYVSPIVDVVDDKWIQKQMQSLKISLKQLCNDTGVDKTSMSAYVNGLKPLSQTVKSMFYYYFLSK